MTKLNAAWETNVFIILNPGYFCRFCNILIQLIEHLFSNADVILFLERFKIGHFTLFFQHDPQNFCHYFNIFFKERSCFMIRFVRNFKRNQPESSFQYFVRTSPFMISDRDKYETKRIFLCSKKGAITTSDIPKLGHAKP